MDQEIKRIKHDEEKSTADQKDVGNEGYLLLRYIIIPLFSVILWRNFMKTSYK